MPTEEKKPTKTEVKSPDSAAVKVREGGVSLPVGASTGALATGQPLAGVPLGLGADVSGSLESIAPTFGNVLASIGLGVANSQAILDQGIIDTVKTLADTKITVVTEVVEELDEDGLPDVDQTKLVTQELSVLNYVTPTVHEWKRVALQMDMEVSALDSESGINVSVTKETTSYANVGLFFGLLGVGYIHDSYQHQSMTSDMHKQSQWAQGRVQMDAVLAPRRTTKFPVPAKVSIGPQIFISQGAVTETKTGGVVTERSIDVLISVRKANGAANPDVNLVLDAAGLLPSFKSDGSFKGSETNAEGKCSVKLTRKIPNPFFSRATKRNCSVQLGDIRKVFQIMV